MRDHNRLRLLRVLLMLRCEATRGRENASPVEWYIERIQRVDAALRGLRHV